MNIQSMMKQAQEMQERLQKQMAEMRAEASAGGGMVKVAMTGDLRLESLTIDPDAVDPDDVEMLQDLIVAAVNEGLRKAQELQAQGFGGITSALGGMPGLGNLLGQ